MKEKVMDSYIVEVSKYANKAKEAWNLSADEHNQWDILSLEEQHEIVWNAMKKGA